MRLQIFAVKLSMLLSTDNNKRNAVGVGFHHDADGLGHGQARNGFQQCLYDMLHGIQVVVVQQHLVTGRMTDSSRTLFNRLNHDSSASWLVAKGQILISVDRKKAEEECDGVVDA